MSPALSVPHGGTPRLAVDIVDSRFCYGTSQTSARRRDGQNEPEDPSPAVRGAACGQPVSLAHTPPSLYFRGIFSWIFVPFLEYGQREACPLTPHVPSAQRDSRR